MNAPQPVAAASRWGKSRQMSTQPRPSCRNTSSGRPPAAAGIRRYSSRISPTRMKSRCAAGAFPPPRLPAWCMDASSGSALPEPVADADDAFLVGLGDREPGEAPGQPQHGLVASEDVAGQLPGPPAAAVLDGLGQQARAQTQALQV